MSLRTSSSPQDVPPASPPPEILRPGPTPTVVAPSAEVVAETTQDESITSLSPAPRTQSPEQPPDLAEPPVRVELHVPDPGPSFLSTSTRPHSAFTVSYIERDRPLPSIPANAALAPQRDALLRPRVASDPGYGHAHRRSHRSRRSEPPPAQPLDIPGSGVFRQRPATHPGEYEFRDVSPAREQSSSQVRPSRLHCLHHLAVTTWLWSRALILTVQWGLV